MTDKGPLPRKSCMHFKPGEERFLRKLTEPKEPIDFVRYKKASRFNKDSIGVRFLGYAAGKPPAATKIKKAATMIQSPSGRMRQLGDDSQYYWVAGQSKAKHKVCIERRGAPPPDSSKPAKKPSLANKPSTPKPPADDPFPGAPFPSGILSGGSWYGGHWFDSQLHCGNFPGPYPGRNSKYDYSDDSEYENYYESVTESLSAISLWDGNHINVMDYLDLSHGPSSSGGSLLVQRSGSSRASAEVFFDAPCTPIAAPNEHTQVSVRNNDSRVIIRNGHTHWRPEYPDVLLPGVNYVSEMMPLYHRRRPRF